MGDVAAPRRLSGSSASRCSRLRPCCPSSPALRPPLSRAGSSLSATSTATIRHGSHIARAAGLIDAARTLGRRQDDARPARRHPRPRAGLAQDRPQPAAASEGSAALRRQGRRRARQPRGDEPARRLPLHDGGRVRRLRGAELGRASATASTTQNRAAIEAAARASNPALTPQQIRDAWMAQHPLGWVEHKLAWSPSGELGRWATRNPAVVKIDGTLFVHGGLSAEYAKLPLERDQPPRRGGDGGGRRRSGDDPLRSARTALVPRSRRPRPGRRGSPRQGGGAPHAGAGAGARRRPLRPTARSGWSSATRPTSRASKFSTAAAWRASIPAIRAPTAARSAGSRSSAQPWSRTHVVRSAR